MATRVLEMEEQQVREGVKNLARSYFAYMIECFDEPEKREKLLENPYKVLTEDIGMTIPEGVNIKLVTDRKKWEASVTIQRGRKTITLTEGDLEIDEVIKTVVEGEQVGDVTHYQEEVITSKEQFESLQRIEKQLDVPYDDGTVVTIQLPFFDISRELFTEIKFEDGEGVIVLTCH